ncbi:MAG: hypothetical protein CM1200mP14_18940 [Gammaproteobacteria bacterium]|nr:MAG: hypothetical protein CM1200mP14_18940 [Gammaproteobacteria bacterium]
MKKLNRQTWTSAAEIWGGPLHGIPYGVKDLFSTTRGRTTWGSADFENQVINEDAELVVRFREAGAVLIAKLATGEFASGDRWFRGRTKNPGMFKKARVALLLVLVRLLRRGA